MPPLKHVVITPGGHDCIYCILGEGKNTQGIMRFPLYDFLLPVPFFVCSDFFEIEDQDVPNELNPHQMGVCWSSNIPIGGENCTTRDPLGVWGTLAKEKRYC